MARRKQHSSHGPLAALVGDVDTFSRTVWGQRPRRSDGDRVLLDLLSLEVVDSLLANGLRRPHFRVLRDGATVTAGDVTRRVRTGGVMVDDFADPERVTDLIAQGATLVLQGLEHLRPEVADFAAELSAALGHRVQANAYLSPPNSAGLVPHTDAHDVFAVQLFGRKLWTVEGLDEAATERGDVLYIPAGVEHSARTDDSWSLHLTIGVHAISVGAALQRAVERLVAAEPAMAHSLPIAFGGAARGETAAQLARARTELIALLGELDIEAVIDTEAAPARRCAASHSPASTSGRLSLLVASTHFTIASTVVGCTSAEISTSGPGSIRITGGRRALTMPARVRGAVEHVLSGQPCRVSDIPDLDDESRLVLVRRLAAEGLVAAAV